jgi:hypothetical protein
MARVKHLAKNAAESAASAGPWKIMVRLALIPAKFGLARRKRSLVPKSAAMRMRTARTISGVASAAAPSLAGKHKVKKPQARSDLASRAVNGKDVDE